MLLSLNWAVLALLTLVAQCELFSADLEYKQGWSKIFSSQRNYLVCGAQMKVRENQTSAYFSEATGLKVIFCRPLDWRTQIERRYADQVQGTWQRAVMCPEKSFVDGFQVRAEKNKKGGFFLNGLRFRCSYPGADSNDGKIIKIYGELEENWTQWRYSSEERVNNIEGSLFFDSFTVWSRQLRKGGNMTLGDFIFYPTKYVIALLKTIQISDQQRGILNQKLKLPFDQFKSEAQKAIIANRISYQNTTNTSSDSKMGKRGFYAHWWGYQLFLDSQTVQKFSYEESQIQILKIAGVPQGIASQLCDYLGEKALKRLPLYDEGNGIRLVRSMYFGNVIVSPQHL